MFDFQQASKKKKAKGEDDEDDEGEGDGDGDGDEDEDGDKAGSGKEDDNEESDSEWEKPEESAVITGETREERTKHRNTEKEALKQRSDDLCTEGHDNYTIMVNSHKVAKVNPIPLYQPWTPRRSAVNSHAPPAGFRGTNLILRQFWKVC